MNDEEVKQLADNFSMFLASFLTIQAGDEKLLVPTAHSTDEQWFLYLQQGVRKYYEHQPRIKDNYTKLEKLDTSGMRIEMNLGEVVTGNCMGNVQVSMQGLLSGAFVNYLYLQTFPNSHQSFTPFACTFMNLETIENINVTSGMVTKRTQPVPLNPCYAFKRFINNNGHEIWCEFFRENEYDYTCNFRATRIK